VGTLPFTSVGFGLAAPKDAGPFFRWNTIRPPIADLQTGCTLALDDDLAVARTQFDLPLFSKRQVDLHFSRISAHFIRQAKDRAFAVLRALDIPTRTTSLRAIGINWHREIRARRCPRKVATDRK